MVSGAWVGLRSGLPTSGGALPNADFGPCLNNWFENKTSGGGGDYVDGKPAIPGGTYYWNQIDISGANGYERAFNAGKPNNNWLEPYEFDGRGTVTINHAPDSAAADLGQSQTAAYNDLTHGGAMEIIGGGSLRWAFNGNFQLLHGAVRFTDTGVDRLMWYDFFANFDVDEYVYQFSVISNLLGYGDPPSPIPNGELWDTIGGDLRFKGNYEPTSFRMHGGGSKIRLLRGVIDGACDDDVFIGAGSDVDVIGTLLRRANNGGNRTDPFHNDDVQITKLTNGRVLDCTLVGHAFEIVAESGNISVVVDRVWIGHHSFAGGEWGVSGHTLSGHVGSGGDEDRITDHYFKTFSMGELFAGNTQQAIVHSESTFNTGIIDYPDALNVMNYDSVVIDVPLGCTVDGNGFLTSGESSFTNSDEAPHKIFAAAYSASDFAAVRSGYNIDYD